MKRIMIIIVMIIVFSNNNNNNNSNTTVSEAYATTNYSLCEFLEHGKKC